MNEMTPKISVIVPVYKAEAYLHRCVDSLLAQTFQDFEILLVDDGSPDKSGEICDEYARKDSRVRVFHKENGGVSSARNLGIENSNAEWVCFVDSDDWVEDDYISNFCKQNQSRNSIVFQGILLDYLNPSRNRPFFEYEEVVIENISSSDIVNNNILHDGCPYAKLFNKSLLLEKGITFFEKLSTHEDHVFVWTYLQYVETIYLSSSLSYHYRQTDSVTLSSRNHQAEEYLLASEKLLELLPVLQKKFEIKDIRYLQKTYTSFGLNQLLYACENMKCSNYRHTIHYIQRKRNLFKHFYITSKWHKKFFQKLLFSPFCPYMLLLLLCKLKKQLEVIR